MRDRQLGLRRVAVLVGAGLSLTCTLAPDTAAAEEALTIQRATGRVEPMDPLSPAQVEAIDHGPLLADDADVDAKASANVALRAVGLAPAVRAAPVAVPAAAGGPSSVSLAPISPLVPTALPNKEREGQIDPNTSPSDATGAIGTSRFVQLINRRFGIYRKHDLMQFSEGTLADFVGLPGLNVFDPQVIWDSQTNRFYYAATAVAGANDSRIAFGYSRNGRPTNGSGNWCKYFIDYGSRFPDYPKLGDSKFFILIGVNSFDTGASFVGSDLIAVSKPPKGTRCISTDSFVIGAQQNLRSNDDELVFTPVPANSVDTNARGFVVARNLELPSNRLWMFYVRRNADGTPNFGGDGRPINLPFDISVPPDASQAGLSQLLDTLDGRPTQAILARNPRRNNRPVIWTQQTVAETTSDGSPIASIRWEEIYPNRNLASSGLVSAAPSTHLYNAAISPDRRNGGLGGSFVISYSASGAASGIAPRMIAGSSVDGGPLSFLLIADAVGPYRDFTCVPTLSTCRWGDYSGATPDPNPPAGNVGRVWITNQFAGSTNTSTAIANWRTRIVAIRP